MYPAEGDLMLSKAYYTYILSGVGMYEVTSRREYSFALDSLVDVF